jgi:DNA-binding CsgD family transcriptional regulator/pimeloyl-ACP methyl ester carboxylesterase
MDAPLLQYVRTGDGYDIAYCVSGAGVPLVYLPHPASHIQLTWRTRGNFRLLFERLSERFKLICYDSRGFGSSTRGLSDSHRSEDFEVDLETVVEHLRLRRFALMAQNNFGRVAMNYAARNPDRVLTLILYNTDLGDVPQDRTYKPSQLETLAMTNWDLYVETIVRTNWRPEDPNLARRFVGESSTPQDWLIRTRAWSQYNALDALPHLAMPALLITKGPGELSSTETVSRYIASQIPDARLAVFDDRDGGGGLFSLAPELPPAIPLIEDLIRNATAGDTSASSHPEPYAALTSREVDVLRLIAAGRSNQQIADELVLSRRTVERHITNLYAKIGAHGKAEATAYALRHGIE